MLATFDHLSWNLVLWFSMSGVLMALLSCLVGMRPKLEIPLWWLLYALWIAVVLFLKPPAPFWTVLIASVAAGLLHGVLSALMLKQYIANNPWHADKMQGAHGKLALQLIVMGVIIGAVFGAVVAVIALGLSKL